MILDRETQGVFGLNLPETFPSGTIVDGPEDFDLFCDEEEHIVYPSVDAPEGDEQRRHEYLRV
jgi:hypothetical protein